MIFIFKTDENSLKKKFTLKNFDMENVILFISYPIHFFDWVLCFVVNRATIVIRIGEKKTKKIHRFYLVRQCAFIHGNNDLNFLLSPNRVTSEGIYNNSIYDQITKIPYRIVS